MSELVQKNFQVLLNFEIGKIPTTSSETRGLMENYRFLGLPRSLQPLASLDVVSLPRPFLASRFARGATLTKIPLASRFARDDKSTKIPSVSRFARGDELTRVP